MEHVNIPGTVSGRLRFSAPHMKSVHMDDMLRQRHLRDRFLKVQGTSTFVIVNPECPIRTQIICMYGGFSTGRLQIFGDSYKPLKM